jgi:hypothetical protein
MTRKKRRKQTGRRHRQRALRREREKLRRKRSEGRTIAVEPAAEKSPVQDDPPASMPTVTADPGAPETPRRWALPTADRHRSQPLARVTEEGGKNIWWQEYFFAGRWKR